MSTLRSVVVSIVDGPPEADGPYGFVKLPIGNDSNGNDEYVILSPETVNAICEVRNNGTHAL